MCVSVFNTLKQCNIFYGMINNQLFICMYLQISLVCVLQFKPIDYKLKYKINNYNPENLCVRIVYS